MIIDTNHFERYRAVLEAKRVNWALFQFRIKAINETKENMGSLLFNIISNLHLNFVCFKYFKDEGGFVEEVIYDCTRESNGRIPDCRHALHANCFNEI